MGQRETSTSAPWGPAQGSLKNILGEAGNLYESGGMTTPAYSGPRVAGFGDVTQQAQEGIVNRASGGSPLLSGMQGTLSNMMSGDYQNDRLDAVKQNALSSAIPAATSMFSGSGMIDSSAAMDHVGRAATQAVAPYEYQAAQQAQNQALQAAGMAPAAYQAQFAPDQMLAGVGQQQDMLSQQQIDADMARYYEGQNQDLAGLQNYANLATAIGGMGGQSQSHQPMGLGGALSILGSGLSLFSDRRLKKNIRKIGETRGGSNIYSYNYKWSDLPQVGVMADEVPDAIAGTVGGYSTIDYARVS